MAKKKKHHKKSRKLRKQQSQAVAANPALVKTQTTLKTTSAETKDEQVTTKASTDINKVTYDDVELDYVKSDVIHTLILVAIILSAYAVIWVLLTHTGLGSQASKLFIH